MEMLLPAYAQRRVAGEVIRSADGEPLLVVAEKSRLVRVFYNLLQNAMRHSPKGGSVTVSAREEGDGFVRVAVEDRGAGIPPEVIPQLFQKFVRRGKSGGKAGLGLYFCRITVEQWGGTIGCEPRVGGGTTFWFRLKRI
jgi:signal transduction histidine kinase